MRLPRPICAASLAMLSIVLAACSTSNTTVPAGAQVSTEVAAPTYTGPQIIHADLNERIATIRHGENLGQGFLVCTSKDGRPTGILKMQARTFDGLSTADILEGSPSINDRVSKASASESERLAKIYRDAAPQNQ